MEISGKIAKDFQLFLQKTLTQKPGQVPDTCYQKVVRKFPIYKLKQKRTKKVKN